MKSRICPVLAIILVFLAASCGGQTTPTATPPPTPESTQKVAAAPTALPSPMPSPTSNLSCGQIIQSALKSVGTTCNGIGRNQACYGHAQVDAEFQSNASAKFDTTGDVVDLLAIKSLRTLPPDAAAQIWGVAVLKAQVNLPDSLPGQNVTFLLFGDSRLGGITPDMRAVSLSTGIGEPKCKDAPPSSMLMQSPQGQKVSLNLNGADITVGSTLYITAQERSEMRIATIEGEATVKSANVTQVVEPGAQVRLPLGGSDGLQASGPPSPPEPYNVVTIQQAPLVMLDRPIQVPPPIETSTPSPVPLSPTPGGVNFNADALVVPSGNCTTLHWDVPNAKSVFFEGQPTQPSSSRQVCPTSTTTYTLLVTGNDGKQTFYQLTIRVQ
jgi:hypothetical protein